MSKGVLQGWGWRRENSSSITQNPTMPKQLKSKEPPPLFTQAGRRWSCVRGFRLCSEKGEEANYRTYAVSRELHSASFLLDPWRKEAAPASTVALERGSWWTCSARGLSACALSGPVQQTVVGKVRQGTWRVKNQLRGRSLSTFIAFGKKTRNKKMEWSSPSCISSAKDPGPRGLSPAAPLVECKVYPSSGSSSLTQACKRGEKGEGRMWVQSKYSIAFLM